MTSAGWEKKRYDAEAALALQIRIAKLPEPIAQFPWARDYGRKWVADFVWPNFNLMVEIDGAPHRIRKRFLDDQEKRLAAHALGWTRFSFSPKMVRSGLALQWLQVALSHRHRRFTAPELYQKTLKKHGILRLEPERKETSP